MERGEEERRQSAAIPIGSRDGSVSDLLEGTKPARFAGQSSNTIEHEIASLIPFTDTESANEASNTHNTKQRQRLRSPKSITQN